MYSTMLCTQYNTPLSTNVIGGLKNVITIYAGIFLYIVIITTFIDLSVKSWLSSGMIFSTDYVFSMVNFTGLTISVVASICYAFTSCSSSFMQESTQRGKGEKDSMKLQAIKFQKAWKACFWSDSIFRMLLLDSHLNYLTYTVSINTSTQIRTKLL